jgi:hypothetical protein
MPFGIMSNICREYINLLRRIVETRRIARQIREIGRAAIGERTIR